MQLWLPPSFHGRRHEEGTHTCRICGEQRVSPSHIAKCFKRNEAEVRSRNVMNSALMRHPEPDLEAFVYHHGGVNRTKERGPIVVPKEIK